ncbi:uncharacterized protein QC763_206710 [Podospora pseudopauciseta]|uniref:L-ornithine N(5)-monooxygenase [NAD(P)H] n=1 Tax=Podospora pseudopauciseta TaxID=2093780 RepID=A0ABR0HQ34_9PEZI|nr:hypothetical protein QC763_206710 [Podospora pseudopauciseta]
MPDISRQTLPHVHDVVIIGAGPCGLAVAARLREKAPGAIFTDEEHRRHRVLHRYGRSMPLKQVRNGRVTCCARPTASDTQDLDIMALDATHDGWCGRWNKLFKCYDIEHLRSPMFWHVSPVDRDALLGYAYSQNRENELLEIHHCVGKEVSKHIRKRTRTQKCSAHSACNARVEINERDRIDYFNPSQALFSDHCRAVASRYHLCDGVVKKESVQDISFDVVQGISVNDEPLFTVTTDRGLQYARTVVLSVGPANQPSIPRHAFKAFSATESLPQVCHSTQIETFPDTVVRTRMTNGQRTKVLVIGGGLTSAQLSDLAIRKGVTKVWHLMRSPIAIKTFDVELSWMSKYRNLEQAYFYSADTDEERLQMVRAARGGGSIPPRYHKKLKDHISRGRLELRTETKLVNAQFVTTEAGGRWKVETEPAIEGIPSFDFIYFATGIETDVAALPYLQTMRKTHPIDEIGGLPCLTEQLKWKDDVPLFVTGRLASLRLGAAGPNLGGARTGAERIALAIQEHFEECKREDKISGDIAATNKDENEWERFVLGRGSKYSCLVEH